MRRDAVKMRSCIPILVWIASVFALANGVMAALDVFSWIFFFGFLAGICTVLSIYFIMANITTILEWFYVEKTTTQKLIRLGIIQDEVVKAFDSDFAFLANQYKCDFIVDSVHYSSVEQFYHAHKTLNDKERDAIMAIGDPDRICEAGRKVTLRKDWGQTRRKVMWEGLCAKFGPQNRDMRLKLIATHGYTLENGNLFEDTLWGKDAATGVGENALGRMLMDLRDRLIGEIRT